MAISLTANVTYNINAIELFKELKMFGLHAEPNKQNS